MGSVVLDSGVIIGFLSDTDVHHDWAVEQVGAALARRDALLMSSVTVAEFLVRPAIARKEAQVLADVHDLRPQIIDVTEQVALHAAQLRARHTSLRTPDALVVATALAINAESLVTTDARLARLRVKGLRVVSPLRTARQDR